MAVQKFRLLITGSRDWDDYDVVRREVLKVIRDYLQDNPHLRNRPIGEWFSIVHGNYYRGIDKLADMFAVNELKIEPERYDADWRIGGRAGPLRNMRMVETMPDACIAFFKDRSKGTKGCRDMASRKGIPVQNVYYSDIERSADGAIEA